MTIVSFSTEPSYRDDFGPFTPGFVTVKYGDADAIEKAITPNTAAVLLEPIQGEAGVIIPPSGYLKKVSETCKKNKVNVKYYYLNCKLKKVADTEYRLIAQLARGFGEAVPATGLPTDEIYKIFVRYNVDNHAKKSHK